MESIDWKTAVAEVARIQEREWPKVFSGSTRETSSGKLAVTNTISAWVCFVRNRRVARLPLLSVLSPEYFGPVGSYGIGGGLLK